MGHPPEFKVDDRHWEPRWAEGSRGWWVQGTFRPHRACRESSRSVRLPRPQAGCMQATWGLSLLCSEGCRKVISRWGCRGQRDPFLAWGWRPDPAAHTRGIRRAPSFCRGPPMLSPGKPYLHAHFRNAERNSHCSPNIYWRMPLELGNDKLISDMTSVQLKCHLSSSCYFFWGPLWIILLSSGPWCPQMTFGQLSASLYCLETKLYIPWSVCGVS